MFDTLEEECVHEIDGVKGSLYALNFSENGRYIAAGGEDQKMYVWDIDLEAYEDNFEEELRELKRNQELIESGGEEDDTDSEGNEEEKIEDLKESLKKLREEDPIKEKVKNNTKKN